MITEVLQTMGINSDIPWVKVNDFLLEIGAATNETDFFRRIIRSIPRLVPTDVYCQVITLDPEGKPDSQTSIIDNTKWANYFYDYYWRTLPDISAENGINTKIVDWNHYRTNEYASDFMAPQRIRYSLGVHSLINSEGNPAIFALNRSEKSLPFSETEQTIMELIQPHLTNYYRLITKEHISASEINMRNVLSELKCLTRREVEITAMLYRGLNTQMISTLLIISPRTVYKHIQNIFEKLQVCSRLELIAKLNQLR